MRNSSLTGSFRHWLFVESKASPWLFSLTWNSWTLHHSHPRKIKTKQKTLHHSHPRKIKKIKWRRKSRFHFLWQLLAHQQIILGVSWGLLYKVCDVPKSLFGIINDLIFTTNLFKSALFSSIIYLLFSFKHIYIWFQHGMPIISMVKKQRAVNNEEKVAKTNSPGSQLSALMSCRDTLLPNNSCTRSRTDAWRSLKSKTFFFISTTVPLILVALFSVSAVKEELAPLAAGTPRGGVLPISAIEVIIRGRVRAKPVMLETPWHFTVENMGLLWTDAKRSRPLIVSLMVKIGLTPVPASDFNGDRLRSVGWNISCFGREAERI